MKKLKYVLLLAVLTLIAIVVGIIIYSPKSISQVENSKLKSNKVKNTEDSIKVHFHAGIDTTIIINGETFHLKDLSNVLRLIVPMTDSAVHKNQYGNNYVCWEHFLTKPHPSVETLKKYFKEASDEFNIPLPILHSLGKLENNWTQIGPTIDQGWGIMHLVKNGYCQTLDEAAQLLGLSPSVLQEDAKQNIRGAAALLAKYAGPDHDKFTTYEEWIPALKKFSGLINDELQTMQSNEYLKQIYSGSKSVTLWGDSIILNPQPKKYNHE